MRWGTAGFLAGCLTAVVLLFVLVFAAALWRWSGLPLDADALRTTVHLGRELRRRSVNRIAVTGEDSNIWLLSPDGSERIELTADASRRRRYHYPTWSPDGQYLAFVELVLDENGEPTESVIHVHAMEEGGKARQIPAEFPPFYLYWNPTGELLAWLSRSEGDTLGLWMLDVGRKASTPKRLRQGQPLFFSWEPEGRTVLAHIGGQELLFLDETGEAEALDVETGLFQAPHWRADGNKLAFVVEGNDGENVLMMSDRHGDGVTELARERGFFTFNWSSDSRRIAFSHTQEQVGLPAYGPLWVHEMETGRKWELSKEPVIAFFWSPDGKYLAFLRPDFRPPLPEHSDPQTSLRQHHPELWLRWHVWNGERTYPLARFSPSRSFLVDYLRFFDQYAQSVTLWSPDSTALLYAGRSDHGRHGVWILPVEEGSDPTHLDDGILASWSPR